MEYSIEYLSRICFATTEGVSLLGINEAAMQLGLRAIGTKISIDRLANAQFPCILHWNQNHFVVLYKVKRGKTFFVADPAKGLVKYTLEEFKKYWISTQSGGEEKGVAMSLEPTPAFYENRPDCNRAENRSCKFLFGYIKKYRKYFGQIVLGLLVGSLLQLILPFLTQAIVDIGIKNQNIGFIWLVLLGQLMLTVSRTALDFIRRWLLLHIENRGIDLVNVNFKYDPHALTPIIDGVSITIPKGKVTAIVGASGSGKTTLIKLMLGYYLVLGGQITVGWN
jgi:ATP-binding cassette subfamily B protein